ncbi:MAG: hypothetical protein ACI8TQ_002436 [Planctomycetota bacterium]|jgi:hypothetical protein
MHVIFVEPAFPRNQREFPRALKSVGAKVTGIGERPVEYLDRELLSWMSEYIQIPSVCSESALEDAVRKVQAKSWVDRIESTVEAHTMPVAHIRERCEIPGTSTKTAYLCRDKPAMKEILSEAGVPCAQSTGASSREEVREFIDRVGYPVILKPRDGAGAAGTFRANNDEELEIAIEGSGVGQGIPTAVEEFIEGHEGFFDTITINGKIEHEFISHYYPGVLEAMRERWISPQIVVTNRNDSEDYSEVRAMCKKVIEVLEIGTSATHMEWFFGPKGLKFSEIGCRPPGVLVWDIYGAANDMDVYQEWANAIVHEKPGTQASRNYAGGMIALRPDCDGQIIGYEGAEEVQREFASSIIDSHFPPVGTGTQGVEGGYMANAWMRLKHSDYDELRRIMDHIGERVKVRAK